MKHRLKNSFNMNMYKPLLSSLRSSVLFNLKKISFYYIIIVIYFLLKESIIFFWFIILASKTIWVQRLYTLEIIYYANYTTANLQSQIYFNFLNLTLSPLDMFLYLLHTNLIILCTMPMFIFYAIGIFSFLLLWIFFK